MLLPSLIHPPILWWNCPLIILTERNILRRIECESVNLCELIIARCFFCCCCCCFCCFCYSMRIHTLAFTPTHRYNPMCGTTLDNNHSNLINIHPSIYPSRMTTNNGCRKMCKNKNGSSSNSDSNLLPKYMFAQTHTRSLARTHARKHIIPIIVRHTEFTGDFTHIRAH